jgi:uncharacterized protein YcfJ
MRKLICLATLLSSSLLPMVPPATAQVVVHKPGHTVIVPNHRSARRHYRRRSRNRRARNTAIGAAGGAAAGAILGGGRGAGAGAVIGGTAGALRSTRRHR